MSSDMSRGGGRRWWWPAIIVIAVLFLAWCAFSVVQAFRSAQNLRATVGTAADHARALDTAELAADIPAITASSAEFSNAVSGPLWAVAARLPVIGSTASSARDLAASAVAMAAASEKLEPVLAATDADSIRRPNGSFDLDTLTALAEALRSTQPELDQAAALAAGADPGALGPVGEAVNTAQEQLTGLPDTAAGVVDTLELTTVLLGADSRQKWAVLLQNGSEARATGGFLGAYALLTADDGRLQVDAVDTNNSLTTRIPNRDMPREFLELWTPEYTSEWNSYNLSRHFPYTGQLTYNGMKFRGTPVDDVLAIDAHVVAALLAGTGPVTAAGETIDTANAERFFNEDVYARYPDVAEKDAVVVKLMTELLDRVTSGDFDLPAAARAVIRASDQGRLLVWSSDEQVQPRLESRQVGGVVPEESQPWVATALNNSAANKLDAFVASSVEYQAASCGTGRSTVTVTMTNNAPDPATAPDSETFADSIYPPSARGDTRMWTAIYGPVGAEFHSVRINGKREFVSQGTERGHPVWRWNVEIPRGETAVVTLTFDEPASPTAPQAPPQAMAVPQEVAVSGGCPQ